MVKNPAPPGADGPGDTLTKEGTRMRNPADLKRYQRTLRLSERSRGL